MTAPPHVRSFVRSFLPLESWSSLANHVYFAAGSNRQMSRQSGRPTNIMPPSNTVNGHGDSAGLTGRREMENIPPTPTTAASCNVTATQAKQKQQQLQSQQQQQQQQQVQIENGRARRSNVVKEVERLKKNREERRQRQAELKEEKEALMNLDPGNPNWEFLAMIRSVASSPFFFFLYQHSFLGNSVAIKLTFRSLQLPKYLACTELGPFTIFLNLTRFLLQSSILRVFVITLKTLNLTIIRTI